MACITAQIFLLLYLPSSVSLGVNLTLNLDMKLQSVYFIMTVTTHCQLTHLGSVTMTVTTHCQLTHLGSVTMTPLECGWSTIVVQLNFVLTPPGVVGTL